MLKIYRQFGRIAVLIGVVLISAAPALAQASLDIAETFAASLTDVPRESLPVTGSVYVPAYSSVSLSEGRIRADFSVTLSIHNSSEERPLVVRRIAYFDTAGELIESYLREPIALRPFGTVGVTIPVTDIRGGTGANFVVDWAATGKIAEPVIEALMLGGVGGASYSFISYGRPIKIVGVR